MRKNPLTGGDNRCVVEDLTDTVVVPAKKSNKQRDLVLDMMQNDVHRALLSLARYYTVNIPDGFIDARDVISALSGVIASFSDEKYLMTIILKHRVGV